MYLSPTCLHAPQEPSLIAPFKAYLYEGLIKEIWKSDFQISSEDIDKLTVAQKETVGKYSKGDERIKHDQDFESSYLGYLVLNAGEKEHWKWEGSTARLDSQDIEKIEEFFNNYPKF